ncbi:hypothetical protein [Sphaerimonospora thailandensis]|uniref:Uncharacterized protein n=1 Tax=Sphaerimonospora thailandensis TaxID=795644 RepID=A0A8J3R740_9ACTN|nr:hypothetical protein [Sphaerimonospora thailandensis]GIH68592.1 hypothetical protein Mth01_08450 [Sphaerimonospora thailandensis]
MGSSTVRHFLKRLVVAVLNEQRSALTALRSWGVARWATAAGGALLTVLVVGVPTVVIPNPLFSREVPVQWWNYPALAATAVLGGLVIATFVDTSGARVRTDRGASRLGAAGTVLSFLAVGCPVCNKLALLLLGASGAMTVWAPIQPVAAVASVLLLAVAAVRRLSGEVDCPVSPVPPAVPTPHATDLDRRSGD